MQKYFQLLILTSFLVGCAHLSTQPLAPQVSLADFNLVDIGLFKQTYRLALRLKNPNPFPLPITALDYQIQINDKTFTKGNSQQAITLPATGEETMPIEVTTNLLGLLEQWRDIKMLLNRQLRYDLSGGVRLVNWVPQIPFERKGEINLSWKK